ncbi:MAG: sigma-70 family RNA polymerase sigma factor [Planctomycetes bacterium]|nr:sigma-70 family RNA polymerase sigma factor [Planctomycetota bacterium]
MNLNQPINEGEKILLATQGNKEAFSVLVEIYQARLRAFAAKYVDNSEEVFDLVQEAFLDAYTHMGKFEPEKEFGPWIRTILKNRIMNHFRSKKIRRNIQLSIVDEAILEKMSEAKDDEFCEDKVLSLKDCVSQLRKQHQDLIQWRYADKVPVKDLAYSLKQSASAISMKLMRIREILRTCMNGKLGDVKA